MGIDFKENSINKMDRKKYEENFNQIDWGAAGKEPSVPSKDENFKDIYDHEIENILLKELVREFVELDGITFPNKKKELLERAKKILGGEK